MRNIRFRGVSIDSGEFVYGGYIVSSGRFGPIHQIHIASEDLEDADMYVTVDAQTVGQLTGLTDKNGVDIYENDVWKREGFIATVEFKYSGWTLVKAESSGSYQYPSFYSNANTGIVIGNIFENKELLAQGG